MHVETKVPVYSFGGWGGDATEKAEGFATGFCDARLEAASSWIQPGQCDRLPWYAGSPCGETLGIEESLVANNCTKNTQNISEKSKNIEKTNKYYNICNKSRRKELGGRRADKKSIA